MISDMFRFIWVLSLIFKFFIVFETFIRFVKGLID
jgi:hypothetical protein